MLKRMGKIVGSGLLALAIGLSGCRQEETPLQLVCIVDLTGSVEAQAQAELLAVLPEAFKQLRRGDAVSVIPITGDALTEGQGSVRRFRLSRRRAAYDADLRRLMSDVQEQLQQLQSEAAAHPPRRSDLFGALGLAAEELAVAPATARRAVVILSDLLQDDAQGDFKRDVRLRDVAAAAAWARSEAGQRKLRLQSAEVYLGLVRSRDLKNLAPQRREALRAFWRGFLQQSGAAAVAEATDGTGQMAQFVARLNEGDKR